MTLTRRDFLKASSVLAASWGLRLPEALAKGPAGDNAAPAVVWLQAAGCSGCSVSLLNTIYYMTIDTLLTAMVSLKYHPTVMAAAGADAVAAAQAAKGTSGYVLVVEGAVPTADNGEYCYLWPGTTALQGVQDFAQNAGFILAVGTCAAYGGMPGGAPNPTGVQPLAQILNGKQVVNLPGCPTHPDWIVGTVAHILANNAAPPLDDNNRPLLFFLDAVHDNCPYKPFFMSGDFTKCYYTRGCKGIFSAADCAVRKWNGGAANTPGVNWCVQAGNPCLGCTDPVFPDGMSPFYEKKALG